MVLDIQDTDTVVVAEEKERLKSCPKIEPINNNMEDLAYNEKLNVIEKEVQSLYKFCMERKFTEKQILDCVSGMYGPKKSLAKKALDDTAMYILVLSVIVALVAVSMGQREVWTFTCASAKLIALNILPYWDWASLYDEDCFVNNHWLPKESVNVTSEFCEYCDNIDIRKLSNVEHLLVAEAIASNDFQPFVVVDVTEHMNVKKLTMDEIMHLYLHHPLLSSKLGKCAYQNDAEFDDMFYDFFKAYVDERLPRQWHASWVNCDANAGKVIRGYHSRPYFLPLMMQLETENTIITSSGMEDLNTTFRLMKDGSDNAQGMLISVISGGLGFILTPNEDCISKFGCSDVRIEVYTGETLFYIGDYWSSSYVPIDSGITIAIANAASWDEM